MSNDKKPIPGVGPKETCIAPSGQPSLFDALKQMVKRKEKITTSKLRARIEAQALFSKADTTRDALDISKTARETAHILARLAAIKARAEWKNEALALHILHTMCRGCATSGESTESLLLKQRRKDGTVRYQIIQSPVGYDELPLIELHRQTAVPLCHKCKPAGLEAVFQPNDPRQTSLPLSFDIKPVKNAA